MPRKDYFLKWRWSEKWSFPSWHSELSGPWEAWNQLIAIQDLLTEIYSEKRRAGWLVAWGEERCEESSGMRMAIRGEGGQSTAGRDTTWAQAWISLGKLWGSERWGVDHRRNRGQRTRAAKQAGQSWTIKVSLSTEERGLNLCYG